MAAHDSQRLKARGMIQDPDLKAMVGQKGIPKGQHGQAKVGNGQPPVPLAKGGSASKGGAVRGRGVEAMESKAMEMDRAKKKCGGKAKMAEGGKVADAKREMLSILGDPADGKTGEWKQMDKSKAQMRMQGNTEKWREDDRQWAKDKRVSDKESKAKMAAGGAAKTRRGIGHGKMPKKGHMAAYD